MKTLSRILVVVAVCFLGIATAHYKLESDLLKSELKQAKNEYRVLSSAYKSKCNQLLKSNGRK